MLILTMKIFPFANFVQWTMGSVNSLILYTLLYRFPILAEEFGDLLVPSIYAQFVENIIFTCLEVIVGGLTVRYYMPCKLSLFSIFLTKNIIQITVGIWAL